MIVTYQSAQVPYVWDRVKPFIQKALDRGSNYSADDILEGLCNQSMQLWTWQDPELKAVLVTTIQTRDDVQFCLFLVMGGEALEDWIGFLPNIENWARHKGCQEMRIYGRAGWAKRTGYEIKYTKMTKEL